MNPRGATVEDQNKWAGKACTYVDQLGKAHAALITNVWGMTSTSEVMNDNDVPTSANLVIVSYDESQRDQYGRQIRRETSVVCEEMQAAHGRFFRL